MPSLAARTILASSCLALAVFAFEASDVARTSIEKEKVAPPNIVFIVADNLNPFLLGSYGNKQIKTPNIDALARQGMKFSRAYAVSGVCSPSRASLLTGLMPSQTGVHNGLHSDFKIEDWSAIEEFRNLPQTLSDAGYYTGMVGKYHLGQPDEAQLGFDYWVTFPSGHTTRFRNVRVIDNGEVYVEEDHLTDFWTEKALHFLERALTDHADKPFFLLLTYNGPYNLPPVVLRDAENQYAQYYEKNPPSLPQEPVHPYLKQWAIEAMDPMGKEDPMKNYRLEDEEQEKAVQERWMELAWGAIEALNNERAIVKAASETSMVDDGVGRIKAALKERGLDENTIVIFTSDQSAAYGQHGLWGNASWASPTPAYDEHMHIPFILSHPGHVPAGETAQIMINQFDIFPTLLDYLGMAHKQIKNTPGTSFAPILRGEQIKWENEIYYEYILTRAVQTENWKYVKRFLRSPNEFYDLKNDPNEQQNLVDDPRYADVINELDQKLTHFFQSYSDPRFNLWQGGTAKAVLMYGDDNGIFEEHFENWQSPIVEKVEAFRDVPTSQSN